LVAAWDNGFKPAGAAYRSFPQGAIFEDHPRKAKKMTRYNRFSRPAGLLLAVIVATLTLAVTAHAVQTITTPNAAFISYNIPAVNSFGPTITPVANQPVHVMCSQTTLNFRGVGQVALLRIVGSFVEWTGLESPSAAGSTITSGFSGTTGAHVLYCDYGHSVDLQVLGPDALRVHNAALFSPAVGNVSLMW
jgi:hypothetical protein